MFGSGRTLYHPLYIDNLVDAFMLCMAKGAGNGREYLIADEHYYPIQEIVEEVGRALDVKLRIPHYPVMPVVVVGHVVEKLCKPFGITPPIFPAPGGLVSAESGLRHQPRQARAGIRAAGDVTGGPAAHRRVVSADGLPRVAGEALARGAASFGYDWSRKRK